MDEKDVQRTRSVRIRAPRTGISRVRRDFVLSHARHGKYSPGTMEAARKEISGRSIHPYAPIVRMARKPSLFNFEQLPYSRTNERGRPSVLSRSVGRPAGSTTAICEQ